MSASNVQKANWLSTAGSVGLAVFFALFVAMLATNWVVIDVRSTGDRDHGRVVVPVPLNLMRIPLRMVPGRALHVPIAHPEDWDRSRFVAALRSLADAPDGTVVTLEEHGGPVELSRQDGKLVITASDRCGEVRASLPFAATMRVLDSARMQRFEPLEALDLLAASERGDLLTVDSRNAHVRIRTW